MSEQSEEFASTVAALDRIKQAFIHQQNRIAYLENQRDQDRRDAASRTAELVEALRKSLFVSTFGQQHCDEDFDSEYPIALHKEAYAVYEKVKSPAAHPQPSK